MLRLDTLDLITIDTFYPKTISAGTGDSLTIIGSGFGNSGYVYFLNTEFNSILFHCGGFDTTVYIKSWTPNKIVIEVPGLAEDDPLAIGDSPCLPGSGHFIVQKTLPSVSSKTSPEILNIEYSFLVKKDSIDGRYKHGHLTKTQCDGITYTLHKDLEQWKEKIIPVIEEVFQSFSNFSGINITLEKDFSGNIVFSDQLTNDRNYIRRDSFRFASIPDASNILMAGNPSFGKGQGASDNNKFFIKSSKILINYNYFENRWNYSLTGDIDSNEIDFKAVFTHEVCHTLGLNHDKEIINVHIDSIDGNIIYEKNNSNLMNTVTLSPPLTDSQRQNLFASSSQRARKGLQRMLELSKNVEISDQTENAYGVVHLLDNFKFEDEDIALSFTALSMEISFLDGRAPYSFQIIDPIADTVVFNGSTTNNSTVLSYSSINIDDPGNYCVKVKDANDCYAEKCVEISTVGCDLSASINLVYPCQTSDGYGEIALEIIGGTPPYNSLITGNGDTTVLYGQLVSTSNLEKGIYDIFVSDSLNCTVSEEVFLIGVAPQVSAEVTPICINGDSLGEINILTMHGVPPLSFYWNTGDTTQNLTNIDSSGTYYVSVTDACDNSTVKFFDVGIFFNASLDNYIHNPSSCHSKDGDIDISFHGNSPEGGVPPYVYQWSTGEETANITGLGAGTYILTITDSEGCAETFTFNLVPEGSPQIILTDTIRASCEGENNGAIEISVYTENAQNYPGQYPAYEILWYNSSGQLIFTDPNNNYDSEAAGLPPDSYTVTVRDISDINESPFSGCISSATFIVEERPSLGPFTVAPQITPSCYGDNTGSIYLNTSGGNPPYTYNWDNGEHTQSIDHLSSPASYSVTITDDCGRQIVHAPLSVPSYSEIINTIVSEGGCPGMIELETSGGTPPYSYLWSNGQIASTATGLANGDSYFLTVTDAAGCTKQEYFLVPIDPEEAFEILISDIQHATSPSAADGRVTVSADESGSITYLWDNDINGPTLTGISSGSYKVTATNAAGCSVARTIDIMDCSEVENFPDFEILASGGLFSNAADEETTLSTLIKEKGEAFFTEEIPGHYSIRWEFPNGNLIGNAPELTVDAATVLANRPTFLEVGWASINLVVSNGCTEKKANHYFIICGQVDEQFANTVLSSFFFIESAVIHPCSGLSDGSITIEIPNPEGLEVSVTRDGIVLPTVDAPGLSVVQETGLSSGPYNFEITIGECVNNFTYYLIPHPVLHSYQGIDLATYKCQYEVSCRGIPLGPYEETAFFNHDNATNFPCEIPILCGGDVVHSKRFRKRTVRGFEYKLILQQLLNFPDFSPFSPDYIEHLILEARRIDDCDRIRYCPATMEKTSSILASLASDNGIENGGNGCFRVHCSGFLGIGFHFDVCTNDLNVPEDLFLDEFDPGTNTCLPEQANLFELYHAWQELDAFIDAPNFHETELHDILLQFGNTPEAKCATIIYCVNDLDQILYNDVESVDCTDQTRLIYSVRGDIPWEENIPICEPPIYVSQDPEGNLRYEVVLCNNGGSIKENVIDYGYFPPSPEGRPEFNPSDIIVDKFSLDTFYIEKLASLGFVINEGRVVPKPIISTDYGQSLYYDYNHTGKVLSKRKIRNTAFHIDNWDTGQALFCFINEAAKEYEIAYFDSLTAWSHILGSDIGINISHFSKGGHKITITGSFSGTLKYDENTIAAGETEQNTMFIATIDMNSQFVKLNTIIGIDSHSGFSVSKNMGGKLAIGGQYHTSDVFFDDVPFNLPSSEGVFLTTYDILSGVEEPNIFISSQNGLQLLKLSQDSTSNNLTAIIKAQGGNEIEINGEPKTLPEGGSYFALNFSNGELNWIFPITSDGIDEAGFDIVYGKEESIFIGLTFENSITIEDEVITSQGGKDIVIMKINGLSGAIDWRRTYGSSADENVVELLYDENTLFFAGELTGHEIYREIGNYNFYNPVPSDSSKAYLSYIFDSKNPSVNRLNLEANIPTERLNEDVKRSVRIEKVFPNPFSRSFTLILNSPLDCESDISLFNLFGEKILSRKYNFTSGENRINYEVPNDMPNGIYYIHMDIDGVKSKNHKLIHIRR